MSHSLIPETPILLQPSLAATLGLDAAVLLSALSERVRYSNPRVSNGFAWHQLSRDDVLALLPFWDARDIQRVITNLREKGVLIVASAPFEDCEQFKFAFNEKVAENSSHAKSSSLKPNYSNGNHSDSSGQPGHQVNTQKAINHLSSLNPGEEQSTEKNIVPLASPKNTINQSDPNRPQFLSKNFIAANWQPDQTTLEQLAQHAIPKEFCLEQTPEFVTYWRERGEAHRSWGAKFLQHVIRQWRNFEQQQYKKDQETAMAPGWEPSIDAMEILVKQAEIPREFIEDAIPEFILYWHERGDRLKTWNTKFIQHVRMQWKKYHSSVEHSTDPRPIAMDWSPSEDVYDVLRLANIDLRFAQELIPEFVLYWKDSNQLHTSWNTRYLQHIKRHWAKRHSLTMNQHSNQANPSTTENRPTREISLEEQLTDRSWAN